jgi:hypothetical protein
MNLSGPLKDSEKAMSEAGRSEEEKQTILSKDVSRIRNILSQGGMNVGGQLEGACPEKTGEGLCANTGNIEHRYKLDKKIIAHVFSDISVH